MCIRDRFIPQLAEMGEPLRQLLCEDTTWLWTDPPQRAFEQIKTTLHISPSLSMLWPKLTNYLCSWCLPQRHWCSPPPPHIQRFCRRFMRFSLTIKYVPGKHQLTAEALLLAPIESPREKNEQFVDELESFAAQTVFMLPAPVTDTWVPGTSVVKDGQPKCHT